MLQCLQVPVKSQCRLSGTVHRKLFIALRFFAGKVTVQVMWYIGKSPRKRECIIFGRQINNYAD